MGTRRRLSAAAKLECDAPLVVAIDYGIKRNILPRLVSNGFRVRVLPATATAADILACNPDGVFLSNGPADPAALPYASEAVRGVLGKNRSSASASAIRFSDSRSAGGPTSSTSAITARTIR